MDPKTVCAFLAIAAATWISFRWMQRQARRERTLAAIRRRLDWSNEQ